MCPSSPMEAWRRMEIHVPSEKGIRRYAQKENSPQKQWPQDFLL